MRKPRHQTRRRESEPAKAASAKSRLTKASAHEAARERWRRDARRFRGLNLRLRAKNELRHITRTPDGYAVRIIRGKKPVFDRHVAGFSEESLLEAMRLRERALREVRPKRRHPIPPRILRALGLSTPVVGICRLPSQFAYRASYRTADGKKHGRSFYYRRVSEAAAYAAAIDFLHGVLEQKAHGDL